MENPEPCGGETSRGRQSHDQTKLKSPGRSSYKSGSWRSRWSPFATLLLLPLLAGCGGVLDPRGQVGHGIKTLIIVSTLLMLLVVIPVIIMTLVFAFRYRASNTKVEFRPNWAHSGRIEAVVWGIPCVIILILAIITWITSHSYDPYQPLESEKQPINVQVVALDWKWLFIYPDLGVASVNELAFPEQTPVNFSLTSGTVMNSFFIPQLGSQVYAMAGMRTKLHLIADEVGAYDGMSANYSGGGFSDMRFKARSMTPADFDAWVQKVKGSGQALNEQTYKQLGVTSERNPVSYYGSVAQGLFDTIYMGCMAGTDLCQVGTSPATAQEAATRPVHETREPVSGNSPPTRSPEPASPPAE